MEYIKRNNYMERVKPYIGKLVVLQFLPNFNCL